MLELRNISKQLGEFSLHAINLQIKEGEYFVVLGMSGAGKSVLLEMIAGLVHPTSGQVFINGRDITNDKIQDREVGIVFQDFAVFPHMNVLQNIAYPLINIGYSTSEAHLLAKGYAENMSIGHLLQRKTTTLSGGELQRVALARTLALKPRFLLLDEPLASIDLQLKDELRGLLRKINRSGITIVHVTHDYEEAISLATRIAVVHSGKVVQVGSAEDVFNAPKSQFIAHFTGVKNFYKATFVEENSSLAEGKVVIKHYTSVQEKEGYLMLRSEDVIVSSSHNPSSALNNFEGELLDFFPCIQGIELMIDVGIKIRAHITHASVKSLDLKVGKKVWVSFKASAVKYVPHS